MFMKTMKFLGFALMAVLASVGFTACGSDDGDSGGGGTSGKVLVRMTEEGPSKTYVSQYTYDSQGRVVKVNVTRNGETYKSYTYGYGSNSITETRINTSSSSTTTYYYTLENGRIVKRTRGSESSTIEYTYDSDGYLASSSRSYSDGSIYETIIYKWSGGNLVSEQDEYDKDIYEYTNLTAPATCIDFWSLDNNLMGFFGKRSRNLPSRLLDDDGSVDLIYDWTMSGGLPIKAVLTETSSKGNDVTIVTFEWQ